MLGSHASSHLILTTVLRLHSSPFGQMRKLMGRSNYLPQMIQTKICKARGVADPEVFTPSHFNTLAIIMPTDGVAVDIIITLPNSINWPLFVTLAVLVIVTIIDKKTETQRFFFNLPHVTLLITDRAKIDWSLVNKVVTF